MTEVMAAGPLGPEELAAFQERLWSLWAAQAARFTMGESTSLPAETAAELLNSLCFTLRVSPERPARIRQLLREDPEAALKAGQRRLEWQVRRGRALWEAACVTAPEEVSQSLTDTLRSMGTFWKRYDLRYFAHQIPCEIDYPLFSPVSEERMGVEYVNEWLERLLLENRFLSRLDHQGLTGVMEAVSPSFRTLPLNLFQNAAATAVGLTLLGRDPRGLDLGPEGRRAIGRKLRDITAPRRRQMLLAAAEDLWRRLGLTAPEERRWAALLTEDLWVRVEAALPAGNLDGVFPGKGP